MIIHIAGMQLQVGERLRQRCSWCGAVLADYDLTRVAVPVGQDPRPALFTVGDLIAVEGEQPKASWVVEHDDGQPLPPEACAQLDDAVTA